MFSYKYIFCGNKLYILASEYYFNCALSSALNISRAKRGNSMWIKRTMASEASQSVYISDHNNAERSEAKVFIYCIISETNEVSERIYIII